MDDIDYNLNLEIYLKKGKSRLRARGREQNGIKRVIRLNKGNNRGNVISEELGRNGLLN